MYLISVYFDEKTDAKIQNLTKQVAKYTNNEILLERKVPPHMTISSFHSFPPAQSVEGTSIFSPFSNTAVT